MKTFRTKLNSSLFRTTVLLSLVVASFPLLAKPVALVTEVKGQVFVVTPEGQTRTLKVNDRLEDKSEIMVGEDGDVSLNDYYDATYHLTHGSHLKFFNKSVQLKKGKAWIQSLTQRHPLALTTANAHVGFNKGEFIATFDQATSKSQVLVVNGEVEVSNVLDRNMKTTVSAGNFTLLDPEEENGLPRSATKVGLTSLNQSLAEFKALPMNMRTEVKREIASVTEAPVAPAAPVKKGEIVFMSHGKLKSNSRIPASEKGEAHKYMAKRATVKTTQIAAVPMRFYGMNTSESVEVTPRQPASVTTDVVLALPNKVAPDLNVDTEFNETFRIQKVSSPKYSKDLEKLIQDLKSY